jgi:tripartite-type tricarboxylate transporter receptor subunit TctC
VSSIRNLGSILALTCGALIASPSPAQSICSAGTVRFLVPFPPSGATTDTLARVLASRLTTTWSRNVIVDNKPGAGGVLSTQTVASSAPDGCTIALVDRSIAVNPSLMKKLPYDTLKDLAMVTQLVDVPVGLIVLPSAPVNSVAELITYAKEQPQGLAYGSPGIGTGSHLAGALLGSMTGANLIHVPYKGTAAAQLDLLAGRIFGVFTAVSSVVGPIRAGKFRLFAIAGDRRFPAFPDVPTIGETIPGYAMSSYFGVVASAGTPRPAVARMSQDIAQALASPEVKAALDKMDLIAVGSTPEAFEKLIRADMQVIAKVVKEAGIETQ